MVVALVSAFGLHHVFNEKSTDMKVVNDNPCMKKITFVKLATSTSKVLTEASDMKMVLELLNTIDVNSATKKINNISNWSYRIILEYENGVSVDASVIEDKLFLDGTYYKVDKTFLADLNKLYDSVNENEEEWIG